MAPKIFEDKTFFITSDIKRTSNEFKNFVEKNISYCGVLDGFELMCIVRN